MIIKWYLYGKGLQSGDHALLVFLVFGLFVVFFLDEKQIGELVLEGDAVFTDLNPVFEEVVGLEDDS